MAKKIILGLLAFFLITLVVNFYYLFALQKNVKQYLSFNFNKSDNEELIENTSKKIVKNYEKINKNIKKIIFRDFSEDLSQILPHFFNENKFSYLVILQNSDELRATGGFMGSYFFIEFSRGMWNLTPIDDIYSVAGQQTKYPASPPGHYEYLSEGKGLFIQDANWWPDVPSSATKILEIWQDIASHSPYLDQDRKIAGIVFLNLNFIENLLEEIGPIQLSDYEESISADNFAEIARANRLDFFAGSKEKANFLNHSKVAIENRLTQLSNQEKIDLIKLINNNLINKNIQLYSQDLALQTIWQKHNFAGQLLKKNSDSFYFFSVETNVGINKANRLINREFHFYLNNDQQIEQISLNFTNQNQIPTTINTNPDLKTADHLTYVNYQRLYFSPETVIKQIKLINSEKDIKNISFTSQSYLNPKGQEFLEISFLLEVPEQKQLQVLIDLVNNNSFKNLEIQKQAGIKQIPIYLYQNQKLIKNWTLLGDQLE